MEIRKGNGVSEFGPGVDIDLEGEEVALAISAYLVAHNVHIKGPRTITVNGRRIDDANIYVDPSGYVIYSNKEFSGRGYIDETT